MTAREQAVARRQLVADARMAKAAEKRLRGVFHREQVRVIAAAETSLGDPSRVLEAVSEEEWETALLAIWRQVFASRDNQAEKQTQQLVALVQQIIDSPTRAREVARFIDESAAGITTTTRRRLATILGETTAADRRDVIRDLRRLYRTDFILKRAGRIALDNVLRATATYDYETAIVERDGLRRDDIELVKLWRTQGDTRVRESHHAANGQTKRLDVPFIVGGEALRYPRDPAGSTGETINCRCTMITRRRRRRGMGT